MIKHLLVAVDGSPFSFRAARLGARILHLNKSGTLSLLYIAKSFSDLEWFQGPVSSIEGAPQKEREGLERALKKGQDILQEAQAGFKDLLKDSTIQVDPIVVPGDPAQKIIENAEKIKCDFVIMGSRGAGALKGKLLGSVSQKVLAGCHCPVLIVK